MQDGDNDELANDGWRRASLYAARRWNIDYALMQGGNNDNVANMAKEELAYIMQQGGETNYFQRALMLDGDNDVAKFARWIAKRLKKAIKLAKLQDQRKRPS